MGLESATYVSDLDASNPLAADKKNQGDDHLRLLKSVLKTTLPNSDRAFRFPEILFRTTNYGVLTTDENKTILCDATAGTLPLTLPTPAFDGWLVHVIKTDNTTNPVFVSPPSGTINGLAKIRVNVPFVEHTFLWTGGTFIRLNSAGQLKAGSLEYHAGSSPPTGYAFATGQSLLRTDYPELFEAWFTIWGAVDGTHFNAPDSRDRFLVGSGGAYGFGATGGEATHVLSVAELPAHDHGGVTGDQNQSHTHTDPSGTPLAKTGNATGFSPTTGTLWFGDAGIGNTGAANQGHIHPIPSAGSGNAHENRPPYLALPLMFKLC